MWLSGATCVATADCSGAGKICVALAVWEAAAVWVATADCKGAGNTCVAAAL